MKTATLSSLLIASLLTVSAYGGITPVASVITEEPSNIVVSYSQNVVLRVKATGTPAPKYIWQFNGTNINAVRNPSSRTATLELGSATGALVGAYDVIVSNSAGAVPSDTVTVGIVPVKPSITSPRNNAQVTATSFLVSGTTTPGSGVTSVQYMVNGAGPSTATQLNTHNWNNWQAPVTLTRAGTNLFQVWAVGSGGTSHTNSATYFLLVTNPISITTNGIGHVTPNLNGRELIVGHTYTIMAVPGAGQYFAGWSGSLIASRPTLTFQMQSNMALVASFVANPFTNNDLAGAYAGLFSEGASSSATNSGYLDLTLTGSGKNAGMFSGRIWLDGSMYSFNNQRMNADATAQFTISRHMRRLGDLTVALILDPSGASGLTGAISSAGTNGTGAFDSSLQAYRTFHHAATHYEGSYTWGMNGAGSGDPTLIPQGYSFGTASVNLYGEVKLPILYMSDGTETSFAGVLDENGLLPLYTTFTTRKYGTGTVMGWVLFTNGVPTTNYNISWFRTAYSHAPSFTNGFTLTERTIMLAPYTQPHRGTNAMGDTNVVVQLFWADLPAPVNYGIDLSSAGVSSSADPVKVSLNNMNGLFSGWFLDPTSNATNHFQGAVLEAPQNGLGYFLTAGTNQTSGSVVLLPAVP
jgi:hypothetical protein